MTIKQAQTTINDARQAGLISDVEAKRYSILIRREGDYGNNWNWQRQSEMRANLIADFA